MNKENKLIVIEGLDGCGKSTQLELLKVNFPQIRFITFPYYDTPSGEIIKKYLADGYGEENSTVSAYTASSFYAVDRYTSFKDDWEKDFKLGKTIISARYVSSNAIYQMTKLDKSHWTDYLNWLSDLEYNKFNLPRPSAVIFLDMPVEISQRLLSQRYSGEEQKKDIHERNIAFMNACREAALFVAQKENWTIINCSQADEPASIEKIHHELVRIIKTKV